MGRERVFAGGAQNKNRSNLFSKEGGKLYPSPVGNDQNAFVRSSAGDSKATHNIPLATQHGIVLEELSICQHVCNEIFVVNFWQPDRFYYFIFMFVLNRMRVYQLFEPARVLNKICISMF